MVWMPDRGKDRHYTVIAEDPLTAVAIGTGKFIEFAHGMTSALEASMGIGGGRNDKEDY